MKNPEWCVRRNYRVNLEVILKQGRLKEDFAYIPIRCQGINWESFLLDKKKKVDIDTLAIVRYDPNTGNPFVFDEDTEEEKRSIIPHRFDADHKPFALSFDSLKGDLVWLAPFSPKKQFYSIYFDLKKGSSKLPEYQGLIGDGDAFIQKTGRLTVPGRSIPVLYGAELFGKKGLIVAAIYGMGIYFFEQINRADSLPDLINRGRLKDRKGNVISGFPTFYDLDGDGVIDLVTGKRDGTVHWFKNTGSNEKPVFESPEPLRGTGGKPIDLKKYLAGKDRVVRLADGTINRRYPKMLVLLAHAGRLHVYTIPQFVDWANDGKRRLLIGASGFLVDFEQVSPGCFGEGSFLRDENGEIIQSEGYLLTVCDWNGDGRPDILIGSIHGFVYYFENIGVKNGIPIFRNRGKLEIEKEPGSSFPLVANVNNDLALFVGNMYGEIRLYTKAGVSETGESVLKDEGYLKTQNAWISRMMPVCRYVDMDGDGRKDLLSGDIQGGLFLYKNTGTDRNPVFGETYQLRDEDGPMKIEGGPDPFEPDDGYSKPVAVDTRGGGNPDIFVGSGLGRIFLYRNLGLGSEGVPYFKKGEVLKDIEGNEVTCHHMSAVEAADWDEDGNLDLIVSGQKDVHALKDDDPDEKAQVKWYRGTGRDKTGFPVFAPYIPVEAEGDRVFQNRPVPPYVGTWEGEKVLYVAQGIFRQVNRDKPEQVEFVRFFPTALIRARENFVGAYPTFSQLSENDGLMVYSSCIGTIFAFRKSFVLNRDYLLAGFKFNLVQSTDNSVCRTLDVRRDRCPRKIESSCEKIKVTKNHRLARISGTVVSKPDTGLYFPGKIPCLVDFLDAERKEIPPEKKMELKIAYDSKRLLLYVKCCEPLMERLIANVDHNNEPIQGDDHVSVIIDPDIRKKTYYCWFISPFGYYKEVTIDRVTGEPFGPYRAGGEEKVRIFADRQNDGYCLQICFPLEKLGLRLRTKSSFLFDIRRRRKIYANEIRAKEQTLNPELYYWSGDEHGRVRLYF